MLEYCIFSLGLIPYFTSRTFIPLFSAALVTQLAVSSGTWLDGETVAVLRNAPDWLTSPGFLLVLGLLALAEVVAGKSPEMRELSLLIDSKAKGTAAMALCLALAPGHLHDEIATSVSSGFSFFHTLEFAWAVLVGTVTWFCAGLRASIVEFLITVDPDDDLGLQGLLSWLEDAIGLAGAVFVVLLPIASLVVLALTISGLWAVRRYLRYREEKNKVPCEGCGQPFAPCGPRCPSCGRHRTLVRAVGLLGTVKDTLAPDLVRHAQELLAQKRCPTCGDRLQERSLDQSCGSCRVAPFADAQAVSAYLATVRSKLPQVLLVLLAVGIVPVLGLIVGVIYYRLSIVASLRCYLPRGRGMVARWGVRIVNLVILCFQPVPILGMFALPAMCLVSWTVYKSLLESQATRTFAPAAYRPEPGFG